MQQRGGEHIRSGPSMVKPLIQWGPSYIQFSLKCLQQTPHNLLRCEMSFCVFKGWYIFYICHYSTICNPILTHWGRAMHLCICKLNIIGSNNGLPPGRHQAITGILLIETLGTNFSEINLNQNSYIFIQEIAFGNVVWRMAAILFWPQCNCTILWWDLTFY